MPRDAELPEGYATLRNHYSKQRPKNELEAGHTYVGGCTQTPSMDLIHTTNRRA